MHISGGKMNKKKDVFTVTNKHTGGHIKNMVINGGLKVVAGKEKK